MIGFGQPVFDRRTGNARRCFGAHLIRREKGDAGVGIGNLAAAPAALGSPEILAEIMSPGNDAVGLSRALEAVPKRGRSFKPVSRASQDAEPANAEMGTNERKGLAF